MMVELSYIVLFLALSLGRGHLGELVSEFFGVGGAGLTFQVLALYPVWSLLLLLFSKPDAPGSHSPAVINGG
jgi:hypothetical protein